MSGPPAKITLDTVGDITPTRLYGPNDTFLTAVAFSRNGEIMITGDISGLMRIWEVETGRLIVEEKAFDAAVTGVAFGVNTPAGDYVFFAVAKDNSVKTFLLYSDKTLETPFAIQQDSFDIIAIGFDPNNRPILACRAKESSENRIFLTYADDETMSFVYAFRLPNENNPNAAFSPNGKMIAAGGLDGSVTIRSTGKSGVVMKSIYTQLNGIKQVMFSPDNKKLAVLEDMGDNILIFDIETGKPEGTAFMERFVNRFQFNSDGTMLAISSLQKGGSLHIRRLDTGDIVRSLKGSSPMAFHPDATGFVCGNNYAEFSKTITLWDTSEPAESIIAKISAPIDEFAAAEQYVQQFTVLKGHTGEVTALAFSPDGMTLATAGSGTEDAIRLWNMETSTEITTFYEHRADITGLAFSPDGKTLVSSSGYFSGTDDNTVRIWDVESHTQTHVFDKHTSRVIGVKFHPKGQQVVSGDASGVLYVWGIKRRNVITRMQTPSPMNAFALSPDGALIATAHGSEMAMKDTVLRLWNTQTGEKLRELTDLTDWILSVTFSPNSNVVLVTDYSGRVVGWDLASGNIVIDYPGGHHTLYNPRTHLIAIAQDKTIKLNTHESEVPKMLLRHGDDVRSMAFNAEGELLAVGTSGGDVVIWGVPHHFDVQKESTTGERQRLERVHSGRHILQLVSLECKQAQERDGDEIFIRIDGQRIWSIENMRRKMHHNPSKNGEASAVDFENCRILGASGWLDVKDCDPARFRFKGITGPLGVEVWEEDQFLRGGDDYIGTVRVSPAQAGQGPIESILHGRNATYVLTYKMDFE